jgi:hypothetical protein
VKEPTVDRCLTLEELLQAGDCELSPETHASVLAHLERCRVCQARDHHALRTLRDVQGYLAGAFGEERQQARRHEFAAGLHKKKQARIHQSIGWPLGRWLPMAALLPVFIVALLLSRSGTVVLQADELLQRAAAAERLRPRGSVQRVRVRLMPFDAVTIPPRRATATFTIVQELTDGTAFIAPSVTAASSDATRVAARLLAQHRFDWQQPLDVARFHAWRRALPRRRDQVIALTDRPLLVLRTTTADDRELREAELTVQRDNFHVVRAAFVFDGVGRLEIEELVQWVRRAPATPPAESIEMAAARDRARLVQTELETRLLLAQTGLDLPGTMRVTLTPAQVRIDGAWPSAAQRRAVNGRLLALPQVSVNLKIAPEGRAADAEPTAEDYAHSLEPGSALALFLEQQFADEHERGDFIPALTRLTTAVHQRLGVMQLLAQRYSDAEIRAFSPEARGTWQHLLDWQYQQLRVDLNGLDTRMRVLGGSESRAFPSSTLPADWPRRTAAGLTHAIAFDRLVQELLAQQDRPLPAQNRGQDSLTHTFRALWDAVVSTRQAQGSRLGS